MDINSWKTNFVQNISHLVHTGDYIINGKILRNAKVFGQKRLNDGTLVCHNLNGPSIILYNQTTNKPKILLNAKNGVLQSISPHQPGNIMLNDDGKMVGYTHLTDKGVAYSGDENIPCSYGGEGFINNIKSAIEYRNEKGQYHRDPKVGPARETINANGHIILLDYIVNGKFHRDYEDGPATIRCSQTTGKLLIRGFYKEGRLFAPEGEICYERYYPDGILQEEIRCIKLDKLNVKCVRGNYTNIKCAGTQSNYLQKKYYTHEGKLYSCSLLSMQKFLLCEAKYDTDGNLRFVHKYVYEGVSANSIGKDTYDKNDIRISSVRKQQGVKTTRKFYYSNGKTQRKIYQYNRQLLDASLPTQDMIVMKSFSEDGTLEQTRQFVTREGKIRLTATNHLDKTESILVEYDNFNDINLENL